MDPSIFKISTVKKELKARLYLYQNWDAPPGINQLYVVRPPNAGGFGQVFVNDWPVYDGIGPSKKLIARAQGTHVLTNMRETLYHNRLNLVFEDARFKGSTIQLMGTGKEDIEWAIVGGTGEFTVAQGVVYIKTVQTGNGERFSEVYIRAFYTPLQKPT